MTTVAIRPTVGVVTGRPDPRDLALWTQWIAINRDTLIGYWKGIIEYTEDAMNPIKPIDTASA
jgi:hypothetical protein